MFGHAIEGLGRLGRRAMVALAWILILIALGLATLATITSGRAQDLGTGDAAGAARPAIQGPPVPGWAQPAFSNQNVSGR